MRITRAIPPPANEKIESLLREMIKELKIQNAQLALITAEEDPDVKD